jgi:hypothetical protein
MDEEKIDEKIEKLDEKIEELVEKRVEQRMQEKKEEMKEEVKQELLQNKEPESSEEGSKSSVLSRRQFMKTAGLGIGALGLSSMTSAWSILQPSSQGTSGIDADTVDGLQARGFIQASETDDGSDITEYNGTGTIASVSGSGCLLGGIAIANAGYSNTTVSAEITVDGGTSFTISGMDLLHPYADENIMLAFIPSVKFESNLEVVINGETDYAGHVVVKQ